MRTGKLNQSTSGVLNAGGWQLIEEYEVTGSGITSYTFSSLNGDVDQEYRIIARVITGSGGGGNEYIRCNNDSAANYGAQRLTGANTTASANRDTDFTGLFFINGNSSGDSNFGDITIKAKSGYVRTAIANSINRIAGTTVTQIVKVGSSWNNTVDNITSLTIVSGVSGGLGVGTHLFLFKRNLLGADATSGIKTGTLNVQGQVTAGELQMLSRYVVPALGTNEKLMIYGNAIADACGNTVTAYGTAAVSSAQYKFSQIGNSISFDGNSDYLIIPDSTDWYFSGDLTIDLYFRLSATGDGDLIAQRSDDNNRWRMQITATDTSLVSVDGGVIKNSVACSYSWATGTWYHLAYVRSGSTWYIFVNGVSQTLTASTNGAFTNLAADLWIGANSTPDKYFNGQASCIRITNGTAKWTSDFTVPSFTDYGGANTQYNLTGLDGNTDVLYMIKTRVVSGKSGPNGPSAWINGDSTTSGISGYQYIEASNTTVTAGRNTAKDGAWIQVGYHDALGQISMMEGLLYAKTGYPRITLQNRMERVSTTTVTTLSNQGHSWNNTSSNITSILFQAGTNGFGVGSFIEVWTLRKKV